MTLGFRRGMLAIAALGIGATGAFAAGCDDDYTSPQASADSGKEASPPEDSGSDSSTTTDAPVDSSKPVPPFTANIGFFNAKSQPNGDPEDGGLPHLLVPSQLFQIFPSDPPRKPDISIPGPFTPLGCFAYKFTTVNPFAPGGPNFSDGDLGTITLSGFTGGAGPGGAIPNPLSCDRHELIPDSGLFRYQCAFPQGPTSGFLKTTDDLTVQIAGGKDSQPFSVTNVKSSPVDNLEVATNLWALPASALDGSSDLQINYSCGASKCASATILAIVIDTSDAPFPDQDPDAGEDAGPPPTPFDFPNPVNEFSQIMCLDLFPAHDKGFTIKKELLAAVPQTWKHARVLVATLNAGQAISPNGIPGSLFGGEGVFGITHRP